MPKDTKNNFQLSSLVVVPLLTLPSPLEQNCPKPRLTGRQSGETLPKPVTSSLPALGTSHETSSSRKGSKKPSLVLPPPLLDSSVELLSFCGHVNFDEKSDGVHTKRVLAEKENGKQTLLFP